jgi:hypothetical protein
MVQTKKLAGMALTAALVIGRRSVRIPAADRPEYQGRQHHQPHG